MHSNAAPEKRDLSLRRHRWQWAEGQTSVQVWAWVRMGCSLIAARRRHADIWMD